MLHPPHRACIRALELAHEAFDHGETPIGAVVCDSRGQILGEGRNRILEKVDPSWHAELKAIQAACEHLKSERIPDAILISTLEPCIMCSGLILHSRISAVAFMAPSTRWPGLSTLLENLKDEINHHPAWRLLEDYENRSSALLTRFFEKQRESRHP
ncbi:MAG: hypothetical protein CMN76_20265 [Spirochaetaceae bacterium]|nr:hypothetical protein [Spirochaetaceae bacterium]|tara:strand:+ start:80121 stop:80591 length:471 start_codon:yes stop_codon:yes gene_type:complete